LSAGPRRKSANWLQAGIFGPLKTLDIMSGADGGRSALAGGCNHLP